MLIHKENSGSLVLAKTLPPQFTCWSRHYHTKTAWFWEEIVKCGIKLLNFSTTELPKSGFEHLRKKLRLVISAASMLEGECWWSLWIYCLFYLNSSEQRESILEWYILLAFSSRFESFFFPKKIRFSMLKWKVWRSKDPDQRSWTHSCCSYF